MTRDIAPTLDLPLTQAKEAQSSQDEFAHYLNAPVRKLDADEYTANDLDGVTESATGSGNLNFLMMQAGQTNEAMGNLNPFNLAQGDMANLNSGGNYTGGADFVPATDNGFDTAMDRGFEGTSSAEGLGQLNAFGNNNATAGSLSASNMAANTASTNPFSDVRNFASSSSTNISTTTPPAAPTNGLDGTDGTNGTDGNGGGDTIIINITNLVDDTTTNLGDVINHTTTNLGDIINTTTTNLGDVINNTTTNLFDTINNTTNNVTNIVNNIVNGGNLGPLGLDLNLTVNELTNVTLDFINGGIITNILNETINTAPILTPVTNLVGTLLSSTALHILYNPFQPDTSAGDTDLHVGTNLDVLGISIPDIGVDVPLDIAEALLGDLDINLDLTNDLLGGLTGNILDPVFGGNNGDTDLALGGLGPVSDVLNETVSTVLNPVENLVGDVDIGGAIGLGLLGTDNNNGGADTDISIPIVIDLIDSPLLDNGLDVNLDPLEHILGDIDLDLGVAGNVLGDIAAPLFDNAAGGNGHNDLLNHLGNGAAELVSVILPLGNGAEPDLTLDTGIDIIDHNLASDGLDLVLDPVEAIIGDVDLHTGLGLDLLGTAETGGSDSDLHVDLGLSESELLGNDIDINLDLVENLTGDIDLGVDLDSLAGETLGGLLNPQLDCYAPSLDGGLNNLQSFTQNAENGVDIVSDSLVGDVDTLLAGNILGDLDSLIGAIHTSLESTLDSAIGLLDAAQPAPGGLDLGALTGGSGSVDISGSIAVWTETVLPNAGDLLGGGLHMDPVALIPDPIITAPIASLPAIVAAPVISIINTGGGLFGGLGGHHGHGGLFG